MNGQKRLKEGKTNFEHHVNYLAHIFLSGKNELLLVGNFMGDGVKGSQLDHLHPTVRQGIALHRAIDSFTDDHPMAHLGRQRLRSRSGKYAGVVLDMLYDHILASEWSQYHEDPLADFLTEKYGILDHHVELMPTRIQRMLPHMIQGDWLGNYAQMDGLSRALSGMSRRASDGGKIIGAERILKDHYTVYREEFDVLFRDVSQMAEELIEKFGVE